MTIHEVEQRSQEWFALRKQYPLTASQAQAIANVGKGLETLVWGKLAEAYSSGVVEDISNRHTERGIELEPQARSLYELETNATVKEVGFITNDEISSVAGASPDGLVGEDGLLEIKCFDDAKHFKMTILGVEIESQYMWQMQMQMLITGRKWCDFLAYNPNFEKSLLIKRVEADEEMQKQIVEGLKKGKELIDEVKSKMQVAKPKAKKEKKPKTLDDVYKDIKSRS
jgi:putative phage-type endonuclease